MTVAPAVGSGTRPAPPSPAAIGWLQGVLRERLTDALALDLDDDGRWSLRIDGADRGLTLGPLRPELYCPGSSPGCASWPAAEEGWRTALDARLPAPGDMPLPAPLVTTSGDGLHFGYDLPGLVFWALARVEEIGRTEADLYGRFPAEASHAVRHRHLERPIVDEWLVVLGQVMERLWPGLALKRPAFRVRPTHDVDEPSRYAFRTAGGLLKAMAGDILRRNAPADALRAWRIRRASAAGLHPRDPYNTFDWIMERSERHGLRSAFYFLCGRSDASRDADYDPGHAAMRSLMRRIHRRGHEIGLHPSYRAVERPDLLAREAAVLRRIAAEEGIAQPEWGGRMHYLRWSTPGTLHAWADAGMSYDSTLGYGAGPGFRCGTCFDYPAFDAAASATVPLRLRPLVAMESSVIDPRYMGLGLGEAALQRFLAVKRACRAVGGQFTLLWHNSELGTPSARRLYEAVLADGWT